MPTTQIQGLVHTRSTGGRYVDIVEDLSSAIRYGNLYDAPFYAMLNREPAGDTGIQWVIDAPADRQGLMRVKQTKSAGAILSVTPTTSTQLSVGDVIRVVNEYERVTAIASTSITVTRGYAGTVRTTHATTTIVTIVTNAQLEGSAGTGNATVYGLLTNQCQIFKRLVQISGSRQAVVSIAGDQWAREVAKQGRELALDIERALFHGKIQTQTANTGARAMKGLDAFLTAANGATRHTTNTSVTTTRLNNFFRTIWTAGGSPNVCVVDALMLQALHELQIDHYQRVALDERFGTLGGVIATQWISPWGEMVLLPDRQLGLAAGLTGCMAALQWDDLSLKVLRDERLADYGRTGDLRKADLIAELTLKVGNPKFHGIMTRHF